jgi:hypothetical protein
MTTTHRLRLAGLGLLGLGGCAPDIQYAALDPSTAPPVVTALRIAPDSASLSPGDTVRFKATTINARGQVQPATGATFSTTGGTVSTSGLYRAADTGKYQVQARYKKGSTVWTATAWVVVDGDAFPRRLLPADNPWNQPVDTAQVDPNSAAIIDLIGATRVFHPDFGANWNGGPFGIPYVVVSGTQARVPVSFDYDDESDPGPYPVPPNPPIEGGASSTGDRHILIVDRDAWKLYELFSAYPQADGSWSRCIR